MLKYTTKSEYILAFSTSSRRVQAVLIHDAPTGPRVIRTFERKRPGHEALEAPAVDVPALEEAGDISFTTGDSGGLDSSLFLASEFGATDTTETPGMPTDAAMPISSQAPVPCDLEIQDIAAECVDAGYDSVQVVFALPTEFLGTSVLKMGADDAQDSGKGDKSSKKPSKKRKGSKRDKLIEALRVEAPGLDEKKVTFLPLKDETGRENPHLAIYAQANEPVSLSLSAIRNRNKPFPNVALMDSEVSLLLGAARAAQIATLPSDMDLDDDRPIREDDEEDHSVLVRVGAEDTLVMFLHGDKPVHFEQLRSITAFDPVETICSRILLMHDEFGEGDADRMFLFCDESEVAIGERLADVFPDTSIYRLRDLMPPFDEERTEPVETEIYLAALAGLRLVRDELWESVFPATDFLDSKLKGRKFTMPFSWPVAAMVLVLFASTLFFVFRFFQQSHQIEITRFELRNFPEDALAVDAEELQSRIDSLKARSTGFSEALDLLDSLLIGTDVWSRALERTSVNTSDVTGLWIESWKEDREGQITINGTAMDRDQIVRFASGAVANIERISFSEIRDVPVYSFEMTMLIDRELPQAAQYLREQAWNSQQESSGDIAADVSSDADLDASSFTSEDS